MIRTITGDNVRSYVGLSTDTKPTDCWTGSTFLEIDTKKLFVFDEEAGTWGEW